MNGAVMLGAAGVWVLCQVLGGRALQRLGLLPSELGDQLPPNGGPTGAAAPAGQAAVPGTATAAPSPAAVAGPAGLAGRQGMGS